MPPKTKLSEDTISSSDEESPHEHPRSGKMGHTDKTFASSQSTSNPPSSPSKNADDEVFFELSWKRRVTVKKWRATVLIDIREYWGEGEDLKPGKKGISLSLEQWKALKDLIPDIDDAISQLPK
jgi:activated RNA polymerase II transcriptional coactivator p15